MPSYAKFLKEILSNKKKIIENETVMLTAECSAIIQNNNFFHKPQHEITAIYTITLTRTLHMEQYTNIYQYI